MNNKNILVPNLPESISDAVVAAWHKKTGDVVTRGELLVELETDKIMLEVPAEETGVLGVILEKVGETVTSGQILGQLLLSDNQNDKSQSENMQCIQKDNYPSNFLNINDNLINSFPPSVRRLINEYNLQPELVLKNDLFKQITRENIEEYLLINKNKKTTSSVSLSKKECNTRSETRVPMTRLRKRIAERLLDVKDNTVMLTTFNEVNMKQIIDLRKKYGETFEKKHGVRLGFMSFYVKAVSDALRFFPNLNASIDDGEIVYHNYFDISIAVSTSRGLVTPILKDVNLLSLDEIERNIKSMAEKGRDGKLKVEELIGGTFTITNGGIFGSLMSTPIINPPQSAILGMHAIKDRPIAVMGEIIVSPMMYLALSYDHRLIDGKDSISFLTKIKDMLENPIQFLLNI